MLLALAIAALGGVLAVVVGIPLPWMLGAIGATVIAALLKAPIVPPQPIMPPMRAILGVLMGSSITPELLQHAGALGLSLVFIPFYVVLAALFGWLYFVRFSNLSRTEAFFAALPGGLYTMVTFAEDLGINVKRIALQHTLRVTLIVVGLPLTIQALVDQDLVRPALTDSSLLSIGLKDLAILGAAGLAGALVSDRLRIPGGIMIVPMLFTAILELTGVTSAKPPAELVIVAQIVLGAGIGGRCIGVEPGEIVEAVKHACGYILIMISLTTLTAFLLLQLGGISFWSGLLSFAPGGLAEMSLIALALGLNVGLIATVHTVRILVVVLGGPVIFKLLQSRIDPNATT